MEELQPTGEAEAAWLQEVDSFVRDQLTPLLPGSASHADEQCDLSVCVVKKMRELLPWSHTLPLSYRLVSVCELRAQQLVPCVSNVLWSGAEHRSWAREAELRVPGGRALPRLGLLLIGCLREGPRGEWRLAQAGGSVRCEWLSPSPWWLNRPVLLPHWNFIPDNALQREQEDAGGHVEMIVPPVLLCPSPEQGLAAAPAGGAEPDAPLCLREATALLRKRVKGQRLSVCGRVSTLCPLLSVAGASFFFFSLTDDTHTLPVLVKQESSRLWWCGSVRVGQSVCVTALRVCALQGWRGNNIMCVTERSEIRHTHLTPHTHTQTASDTAPPPPPSRAPGPPDDVTEEAEPDALLARSAVRLKASRVISYQGVVTEVLSEGAGLYVMDGSVGLCLAYQPKLQRNLRTGDGVELHHVHFLYGACPDFLPSVLCTCLRSTLRVTTFGGVAGAAPEACCPGDQALRRLLVERNAGVSEFLWAGRLCSQLRHSLLPCRTQQCLCVLSWKLMELVWKPGPGRRRDIYAEMLDTTHVCPLTLYRVFPSAAQYVSVCELRGMRSSCAGSASAGSPDSGGGGGGSWSWSKLSSEPGSGPRPLLLLGVLELPSRAGHHSLQLRDGTGAIACVLTETGQDQGRAAVFNTAWIGCLVCVQRFTLVTERFLHSDFPSYQPLEQDNFITHKHDSVYLQFSLDHAHILSPSVTMETQQQQEEGEGSGGQSSRKRRRQEEGEGPSASASAVPTTTCRPCVSMVIRVEEKEGVVLSNTGGGTSSGQEAGLTAAFTLRASRIGPVVSWRRDPKNGPMTEDEAAAEEGGEVLLLCAGVCARWFPVLHPGCLYRLVAVNTEDRTVLIGCSDCGRSLAELDADPTLRIQPEWRFHTLTPALWPRPLHQTLSTLSSNVSTVSQVLDCSSVGLVCFQGLVCDRIGLNDRTSVAGHTHSGVRLTLCEQSGRSIHVYLDLSHTLYPPGLLPGNTLLMSAFQRKVSRCGGVYCSNVAVSSITVIRVSCTESPPPPPIMHLALWAQSSCSVARVKGHLVSFLLLQLQWTCSACDSTHTQCSCSVQGPSSSAVFQSTAKLVMEDGTGEAHVWFSGALVGRLLRLAESQWEGLRRAVRVRGHVTLYSRGRSLVCDSDDALTHFLSHVCRCQAQRRRLLVTCRKRNKHRPPEVRRFSRGEQDFVTRMTPPLQLTCLHLH